MQEQASEAEPETLIPTTIPSEDASEPDPVASSSQENETNNRSIHISSNTHTIQPEAEQD